VGQLNKKEKYKWKNSAFDYNNSSIKLLLEEFLKIIEISLKKNIQEFERKINTIKKIEEKIKENA